MRNVLSQDKLFFGGVGLLSLAVLSLGLIIFSGDTSNTISTPESLVKKDSQVKGAAAAKVVVVEFADFQCPACRAAYPITKKLVADYKDKIKFVYRHFPLTDAHEYALQAAEAAEAAGEQGKFWEYHDLLFENQENLAEDDLINYAKQLNLDVGKFREVLDSGKYKDKVLADLADGQKAGVNSTPTFFINGKNYAGVLDSEKFRGILDGELRSTK